MIKCIKNLIRYAKVTLINDDSSKYPYTQMTYNGKTANVTTVNPYGHYSVAPLNSLAVVWQINAQEENLAGVCFNPAGRFKGLKTGEVLNGNELTGSYIKFANSNEIDIVSKGDLVLNITGNVTINCQTAQVNADSVTVDASFTVAGANISTLGESGQPIARLGDAVLVDIATGIGTITSGGQNTSI